MQQGSDIVTAAGGVKARLALYQEQCRKQKEVKKYEEIEVNKLHASLTDVSRFQSPTKRTPKSKAVITPTQGKKPAALSVFQLDLSPSARGERSSWNTDKALSPSARGEDDDQSSSHNNYNNNSSYRSLAKSPGAFHASRRGMFNSPRMPGYSDSSSGMATPKSAASTKSGASSSSLQKPQQVKDEEEAAAKSELGKVLEAVVDDGPTKAGSGAAGEPAKEVTKASFVSVRSRYLMAVKKLAPVDIKAKLSAVQDKDELRRQTRAAIRAEQQKKAKYGDLKSAWDQYEQAAQDKSRDPDDEDEQEAREQLDKIEEAIDKQWVGFAENVVEVVQKTRDAGEGEGNEAGEEGDLLYWIKESKRLKAESVARRKKKIEQRMAAEEQYWIEEAIKLRDQAKLKRSNRKGGAAADDSATNFSELEESSSGLNAYKSPNKPSSARDLHVSPKSLGIRVAEYTKAASSSPTARQGPSPEEVEARVEKYAAVRTRKLLPEEDDDSEDEEDLAFWVSEAKRLQGKPKRSFRNKSEEEAYWLAEARTLRDAVRAGKGPSPFGEIDAVEQAILEERVQKYAEIQTRKFVPEDDEEDEDLDYWIEEAKRLRGDPKIKFRSAKEEEEFWREEAIKLRESIRNGCGPNPYDFVQTVGAKTEDDSDSVLALSSSVRSLGSRVAAYSKATSRPPRDDARAIEVRVQKYAEIRTRKYSPEEDEDDSDLDFWIAEAKRLQGKPKTSFRNVEEEEAYWLSEAKKLRELVRSGNGPSLYDGTSPCDDVQAEEETVSDGSNSVSAFNSSVRSLPDSHAKELAERVSKYNAIKTRKYAPDEDEDDDSDLAFWVAEAKRLRGSPKRKFKDSAEEELYWAMEAKNLRESIRNGTGPHPLEGTEHISTEDIDDHRLHGKPSELRNGFASPPRVKVPGQVDSFADAGADADDESSESDTDTHRVHGKPSELRNGFASPPRVKVPGQAQPSAEAEDVDELDDGSSESEGGTHRVHGKPSKLRNGFAAPPRVKVPGGAQPSADDDEDEDDGSSESEGGTHRVHGKPSELRNGFAAPPRVKVPGQAEPPTEAGESAGDSRTASSGMDRKNKKKSRKERFNEDSSASGSSDESDSDEDERVPDADAKPSKRTKSRKEESHATPKGMTTTKSSASGGKRSKAKARPDSATGASSNSDAKSSRSSKLKTYMENMPKKTADNDDEIVVKKEEPRNLDGSLWKNPLNRWTNRPTKKVSEAGTAITMRIAPKTDCWRKTRHNFIMDNAPYNWHKVSGDFEVMVKVSGGFSTMYDKAGLMVRQDDENWILTGMEYFNDRLNHSTSITRDFTDWSLATLPATAEKGAWFRLRRVGNAIETSYSFDTENWVITREGIFFDRQVLQVGICGASPMGRMDLKVTFEYYRVKSI